MFKQKVFYILIGLYTLFSPPAFSSDSQTECKEASIKYEYKGNNKYAWFYITNSNKKKVEVVVENSWDYEGRKSETKVVKLSSKEKNNVFNFPRNQNPKSKVLSCSFI